MFLDCLTARLKAHHVRLHFLLETCHEHPMSQIHPALFLLIAYFDS